MAPHCGHRWDSVMAMGSRIAEGSTTYVTGPPAMVTVIRRCPKNGSGTLHIVFRPTALHDRSSSGHLFLAKAPSFSAQGSKQRSQLVIDFRWVGHGLGDFVPQHVAAPAP